MRVTVIGHGLSFDTGEEWTIADGYTDEETQRQVGIDVRSRAGVSVNLRAMPSTLCDLTDDGLRTLLRAQAWTPPPIDETTSHVGPLTIVAGTFLMADHDQAVREAFLTDGSSLANLAASFARGEAAVAAAQIERLAATIRFERAPGR